MEDVAKHWEKMGLLRRDVHVHEELADPQGSVLGARVMTMHSEPEQGNTSQAPEIESYSATKRDGYKVGACLYLVVRAYTSKYALTHSANDTSTVSYSLVDTQLDVIMT